MMHSRYCLEQDNPQAELPLWTNRDHISLVGMLPLTLPESDLDEDSPLPYGHLAFVEDEARLWVCRAWYDGQELGQLVLQFGADRCQVIALHDWQLIREDEQPLRHLLLALMASAEVGVHVIAADEPMQTLLQHLLGALPFDLHNGTRLFWTSHAGVCLP